MKKEQLSTNVVVVHFSYLCLNLLLCGCLYYVCIKAKLLCVCLHMLLNNHCGCVFVHRHLLLHCVSAKWRLNHKSFWTPVVIIIIPVFKLPAAEFLTYFHFSCQKNHLHSSISILFSSWTTCRPTQHNKTLIQTQLTLKVQKLGSSYSSTVMLKSRHHVNRNLVWRNYFDDWWQTFAPSSHCFIGTRTFWGFGQFVGQNKQFKCITDIFQRSFK